MNEYPFAPPGTKLCLHLERNERGRDLVVGDIHGHFETLRHALAELEVGEHDRVMSLGDLVDRGPRSHEAKEWLEGADPKKRFALILRGNHEQLMLNGLQQNPKRRFRFGDGYRAEWSANGGDWWMTKGSEKKGTAWIKLLEKLPLTGKVKTRHGPVGLVHADPVFEHWDALEEKVQGDDDPRTNWCYRARSRALWSRVRYGIEQRSIGEAGEEYLGPVEGVRAVVTGHTPVEEPVWHDNVLNIDTGVHIEERGYGHLTIARIDTEEIETFRFARREGASRTNGG